MRGTKGRKVKKKIAMVLAALMMISGIDVSGENVVKAAEETTVAAVAESMPQTLTVTESSGDDKAIITEGKLQDDGIDNNEAAIYQGENWYYDSTTNQLIMNNASIKNIQSNNGDLTVLLYGENTISENFYFYIDAEKENTLKIMGCDNKGSLTVTGEISDGSRLTTPFGTMNLNITDATIKTSLINCKGSLAIENSEVIGSSEDRAIDVDGVTITNSYIEAISDSFMSFAYSEIVCISGSQIVMEGGKDDYDDSILYNNKTYNSIITLKWKESGATVSKTNVYGIASLKKDLTLESTDSINFYDENARIANMERFSAKEGAGVFIYDIEHEHNTDGGIKYTWKNDSEHTKGLVCRNCPIAYVAEVTEAHSPDESGLCACDKAYQPAVLTTDKYDVDKDGVYDKVYEISNADQLYWFANKINNENYTSGNINAVLTADIVVNENVLKSDGTLNDGSFTDWTPIGMWAGDDKYYSYSGIFDGQNHTISGLYLNQMGMAGCVGLFGHVGSGGKVSNVRVLDSYFSVNGGVGGVCGYNDGTITNCYNAGMINKLTDDYANDFGGVCGYNTGTIIDCYNTGNVSGVNYNGGVCGDNDGTIINCYNTGGVSGDYHVGDICGDNYGDTVTNCYYLSDTEIDHKDGTVGKTKEQFANGEVAYLLQADRTETIWGQTIGTDLYPVLGGKKVYQNKEYDSCNENGNVVAITYSNEQENKFTHTLVKTDRKADCVTAGEDEYWTCSVCRKMFRDKEGENEISSIPVIDALGHDFAKDFTVDAEATCKNVGSKSRHCIRCDAKTDVTEIPASGHNMKKVPAKEATEKETGNIEYYVCSVCQKYFSDEAAQNEITDKTSVIIPVKEVTPAEQPGTGSTEKPEQPDTETTENTGQSKPAPKKKGTKFKDAAGNQYKVTGSDKKNPTVEYVKPKSNAKGNVKIPATARYAGVTYKVTSIADKAFRNNKKVTNITVGTNVKSIGRSAFEKCTKLKTVTVGKNVTKIGKNAFGGCKNLKRLTIKSAKLTKKGLASGSFKGITKKTVVKVPKGKVKAYKKLLQSKGLDKKVKVK